MISVLLAYGTAVKQVFVPLALAMAALDFIHNRPKYAAILARFCFSMAGFVAFAAYCWLTFDNFFLSSQTIIAYYEKKVSLFNLIDMKNYARHIGEMEGLVAFASMLFLASEASRIPNFLNDLKNALASRIEERSLPVEMVLWWLALASTALFVFANAHASVPFASMMRYQTANIPIFLLLAYRCRHLNWLKLTLIFAPVLWISLYWQHLFVIRYWRWEWVS